MITGRSDQTTYILSADVCAPSEQISTHFMLAGVGGDNDE
jgi:hypothetical protein